MPQLDLSTFPNQIFWLIVTLVAIYFILSKVALPRIASVLAERQGTLTNDLAAAEDLKRQAAEAEEAYNKALADARAEAQRIADEARAEIQAQLAEATARADEQIAARTAESEKRIGEIQASATESVGDVARDVAGSVVTAIMPGQTVDNDEVARAVSARMKG
ncbi:F0F1 ATP synthase subunit B' [Roseibacterium sp. SDUM158017]|uniref:F0F1 ATP synthase subunit B' n=1 Tax=Roseicyclus salinarum TaxID=3036773 RepID=UPI0024158DD3|nr:F0F1 ATP synthase subunit B' [Roseibacterium sp. SDUM158017]MDG4649498.1 F0F1 ATP synthase subunit B' [Roseibacterium sp. SDUM158017]